MSRVLRVVVIRFTLGIWISSPRDKLDKEFYYIILIHVELRDVESSSS